MQKGHCIGVMAPSSYVERADIQKSSDALHKLGYKIKVHPQTYAQLNQSAGTTDQKCAALHDLYSDTDVDAIWAAGGGNRALYMLDDLDYRLIAKNPKPLIGFSDVTPLLNAIYKHTGQETIHAQVFKNLHSFEQLSDTLDILSGAHHDMDLNPTNILRPGSCEGVLVGGCLSLFQYLPGTNDCPNLQGAILFLEDTGEEISRLDRMFAHMSRMGVFEHIGGLVLGELHNIQDSTRPFGFSLHDIIADAVGEHDIPIVTNAPFGHGKNLKALPIGRIAKLDTHKKMLNF